jgi:cytochrome P450
MTHNKYFDKDPYIGDNTSNLIGRSILFANSNAEWKKRRTALSPTFYKGKMQAMIKEIKTLVDQTCQEWVYRQRESSGGVIIVDIIKEIASLYSKIMLKCAIGESLHNNRVDFYVDGENRPRPVGNAIRDVLG